MDKYIYDDNNGLWYELQGEYYIPVLHYPPKKNGLSAFGGNGIYAI